MNCSKYYLLIVICLFLISGCTALGATQQSKDAEVQTLDLEQRGAHYFLNTHINGVETSIMLESGVPALLLDMRFYTENKSALNCDFKPFDGKIKLLNRVHDIVLKCDATLQIGDVHYQGPVFILSGNTPPAIPIQFLKSRKDGSSIVKIDLTEGVLEILSRAYLREHNKNLQSSYPLQFNKFGMPVIQCRIGLYLQEKALSLEDDFILDYGNGSHLFLLKGNQAVRSLIDENRLKLSEAKNRAGEVVAEGVLLDSMTLMGRDYKSVSVGITDKLIFDGEAGLIGLKSLQECLIFDIDNDRLYIRE